jgi:hypothetical protein
VRDKPVFPVSAPPQRVYRVTRATVGLTTSAADEITPAGKFDDEKREFRILYASISRASAYREKLEDFRPSRDLLEALRGLECDDEPDGFDATEDLGMVPMSWLMAHSMQTLSVGGSPRCVDITARAALDALRQTRNAIIGVKDILGDQVQLSRGIARQLYLDNERYDGIIYPPRCGDASECVAFFGSRSAEGFRAPLCALANEQITVDDLVFMDIVNALGLRVAGYAETQESLPKTWVWHEIVDAIIAEHGAVSGNHHVPAEFNDDVCIWTAKQRLVLVRRTDNRIEGYGLAPAHEGLIELGEGDLCAPTTVHQLGTALALFLSGVDLLARVSIRPKASGTDPVT